MSSNIRVAAVTCMGQKHRQRGIPCEDYSLAIQKNDVSVVCISDGAGGKEYTHARYGSKCAAETVAALLTEHFDDLYYENREAATRALIIAAIHTRMADIIDKLKLDSLDRLSCTLLFCAVKDRRVLCGHIGDGLIVRVSSSGMSPITMPQNGSKASSTYFVTAAHAPDYLRLIKTTTDDVHAIALMTDGVQDSVYNEGNGLVKPVVARMSDTLSTGRESAERELRKIIEKFVVGASNVSDDASFGVLYFENTKPCDVKNVPSNADAFPRKQENGFKLLQQELIPLVKKAHSIISECSKNVPVMVPEKKNDDEAVNNFPEHETQDTITDAVNGTISKKAFYSLCGICVVLLLVNILFFVLL